MLKGILFFECTRPDGVMMWACDSIFIRIVFSFQTKDWKRKYTETTCCCFSASGHDGWSVKTNSKRSSRRRILQSVDNRSSFGSSILSLCRPCQRVVYFVQPISMLLLILSIALTEMPFRVTLS